MAPTTAVSLTLPRGISHGELAQQCRRALPHDRRDAASGAPPPFPANTEGDIKRRAAKPIPGVEPRAPFNQVLHQIVRRRYGQV
jgi:hypothetical protein